MHVNNHGETVDSKQEPLKMDQIRDIADHVAKTSILESILLVILFVQLYEIL